MVAYRVVRSQRRKTVSLQVTREGVVLRCPHGIPMAQLDAWVTQKRDWIQRKQEELAARPRPPVRRFADGEEIGYLGDPLVLRRDQSRRWIGLEGGILWLPESRDPQLLRGLVKSWYQSEAGRVIPQRVEVYRAELGVPMPPVLIRDPRRRWGSCNAKGELRFNWRLMMAPLAILDYVVVHELCHLRHLNHSAQFWECVGSLLPDYKARRQRLKQISHQLEW